MVVVLLLLPVESFPQPSELDKKLLRKVNQAHAPWADDLIRVVEDNLWVAYVTGPAVYAYGLVMKSAPARETGVLLSTTSLLTTTLTTGTKRLVNRRRPFEVMPDIRQLDDPGSPSFPSGHTSAAFAVAGAVTFRSGDWRVALPLYLWATVVGYGRMYQGVHYPSDVLVGALYGTASAYAVHRFRRQILSAHDWIVRKITGRADSSLQLEPISLVPGRRIELGLRIVL
jgi:undecaprenyl-diphosphatase